MSSQFLITEFLLFDLASLGAQFTCSVFSLLEQIRHNPICQALESGLLNISSLQRVHVNVIHTNRVDITNCKQN